MTSAIAMFTAPSSLHRPHCTVSVAIQQCLAPLAARGARGKAADVEAAIGKAVDA